MLVFILFTCIYSYLIIFLWIGFLKVPVDNSRYSKPSTKFSIVIPFRNEEKNLNSLVQSIQNMDYPNTHFEVLFINDGSTDNSLKHLQNRQELSKISYRVMDNKRRSNSPKKDAIQTAISSSQYNWILTTDADCVLPHKWLSIMNNHILAQDTKMVIAPVSFQNPNSFLEHFQLFDNLSLQGSTIGGFGLNYPFLSNGANLAYQKEAFLEVNGFVGNDQIASGDDCFLMEKFLEEFPQKVSYLKSTDSIVTTHYERTWNAVFEQRIRWASKSKSFRMKRSKIIGTLVFGMNFSVLSCFILSLLKLSSMTTLSYLFISKCSVDFLLIGTTALFFKKKVNLLYYAITSTVYPFLSTWIVLKSLQGRYQWKERMFTTN